MLYRVCGTHMNVLVVFIALVLFEWLRTLDREVRPNQGFGEIYE